MAAYGFTNFLKESWFDFLAMKVSSRDDSKGSKLVGVGSDVVCCFRKDMTWHSFQFLIGEMEISVLNRETKQISPIFDTQKSWSASNNWFLPCSSEIRAVRKRLSSFMFVPWLGLISHRGLEVNAV